MKNLNQERLRASARHEKSFSRRKYPFWNGINVHHEYLGDKDLSWWDDIGFHLGKYYISVAWIHPRMAYHDAINDEAYNSIKHLSPDRKTFGTDGEATYSKVGKSRKKLLCRSMTFSKEESDFYAEWRRMEKERAQISNIEIVPAIKTFNWRYARGVYITAPIEVLCKEDLIVLRDLVRDLITGKTTMAEKFPGYVYTKEDWNAENAE